MKRDSFWLALALVTAAVLIALLVSGCGGSCGPAPCERDPINNAGGCTDGGATMERKVTRVGWTEHQRKMLRAVHMLDGLPRVLDKMGAGVVEQYQRNISQGRSPKGKFAKLTPDYAKAKAKRWGSKPILEASGAMRGAFVFKTTVLGEARFRLGVGVDGSTDAKGVKNADKAGFHVDGTPRMRARNFAAIPKALVSQLLREGFLELHAMTFGKQLA